ATMRARAAPPTGTKRRPGDEEPGMAHQERDGLVLVAPVLHARDPQGGSQAGVSGLDDRDEKAIEDQRKDERDWTAPCLPEGEQHDHRECSTSWPRSQRLPNAGLPDASDQ